MNAMLAPLAENPEHEEALKDFARQVARAGLAPTRAGHTTRAYAAALQTANPAAWRAFYVSLYEGLRELVEMPVERMRKPGEIETLLLILEDDFGSTLVAAAERKRIRARLVE